VPQRVTARVGTGGPFGALLAVVAVAAFLAVHGVAAQPGAMPPLTLNFDGTLEVVANGTHIRTSAAPGVVIPAGTYAALVNDEVPDARDTEHIFHLSGPGVNVMTDLLAGDEKSELYTITLQPNAVYVFQDDREPNVAPVVFSTSSAKATGSGGVTTPSASGTTSNTPLVGSEAVPFRGTLVASVNAGRVTLTRNGKSVSSRSIRSGHYKIAVSDETPKAGFVLARFHKAPQEITSVAFVGARSATVSLTPGRWFFYSAGAEKNVFFVVG
jgi:hypothetical protein